MGDQPHEEMYVQELSIVDDDGTELLCFCDSGGDGVSLRLVGEKGWLGLHSLEWLDGQKPHWVKAVK
jgi:hypothetical protein